MQELEQRLLEAEQRAENAETQVTGQRMGRTVQKRPLAFPDPSEEHTQTYSSPSPTPHGDKKNQQSSLILLNKLIQVYGALFEHERVFG